MNAKEWLTRARTVEMELRGLEDAREIMIEQLTKASQDYTRDPVQSSRDPHAFDRLGDLAATIEERTRELHRIKAETIRAVSRVQGGVERIVLLNRYVNNKRFEKIAVENNISIRNVWRIHGRALRAIEEMKPWEKERI